MENLTTFLIKALVGALIMINLIWGFMHLYTFIERNQPDKDKLKLLEDMDGFDSLMKAGWFIIFFIILLALTLKFCYFIGNLII